MGKSCREIAQTLVDCMRTSPCVVEGGEVRDCMKKNKEECQEYRNAYFTCRRAGLDMRTRIKGLKVY